MRYFHVVSASNVQLIIYNNCYCFRMISEVASKGTRTLSAQVVSVRSSKRRPQNSAIPGDTRENAGSLVYCVSRPEFVMIVFWSSMCNLFYVDTLRGGVFLSSRVTQKTDSWCFHWTLFSGRWGSILFKLFSDISHIIIKTNHVQLKSRISRQWFTQNVF